MVEKIVHPFALRKTNGSVEMEMEKMMAGCRIPAFGVWNYCHGLPITQYFDTAVRTRLTKRWNRRADGELGTAGGGERLVLFKASSFQHKPTQIKVIRREVEKHCNGGELQDGAVQVDVGACAVKRKVVSRAVDEDLYKVPQSLLYEKPKKMKKVVWSMWIGCLGLDCIA